jgi:hypothetical protein
MSVEIPNGDLGRLVTIGSEDYGERFADVGRRLGIALWDIIDIEIDAVPGDEVTRADGLGYLYRTTSEDGAVGPKTLSFLEFRAFGTPDAPDRPELLRNLDHAALYIDSFANEVSDTSEDHITRSTLYIRPKDADHNQRNDPFIVTDKVRDPYGKYEPLAVPDVETTILILGKIAEAYVGATQLPKP